MKREIFCTRPECLEVISRGKFPATLLANATTIELERDLPECEHVRAVRGFAGRLQICDHCLERILRGEPAIAVSTWSELAGIPWYPWEFGQADGTEAPFLDPARRPARSHLVERHHNGSLVVQTEFSAGCGDPAENSDRRACSNPAEKPVEACGDLDALQSPCPPRVPMNPPRDTSTPTTGEVVGPAENQDDDDEGRG